MARLDGGGHVVGGRGAALALAVVFETGEGGGGVEAEEAVGAF
jgi:hypothetical protein